MGVPPGVSPPPPTPTPGLNIPSESKIRTVELPSSPLVMPGHTLDCEQFLFCSKIREEERKEERNTSPSGREERDLRTLSHASTLTRFVFFPTDFRDKKRLLAV